MSFLRVCDECGAPPAKAGGTSLVRRGRNPAPKAFGFHPFIHVLKHVAFWCVGKKKIKQGGFSISVIGPRTFRDEDYCKSCWTDKTKWEKIHHVPDKRQE